MNLLLKKGIFPYEYLDDFNKFNEKKLPEKSKFYSSLSFSEISDEDYEHAKKVWKEFNCKTFGDYHDLYLQLDTCLLADIFETFRDTALNVYKLDPCHYYSSPRLTWMAALKITKVKLELLTDYDKFLFIEQGN
jgi:hypothetical protein